MQYCHLQDRFMYKDLQAKSKKWQHLISLKSLQQPWILIKVSCDYIFPHQWW